MYFKNENSEIEIIVNGYTELPEKYDEEIGKNALSCTILYSLSRDWGEGVMFEELFQTSEIILLHDKIIDLLAKKLDTIEYRDEWNYFTFVAQRIKNEFEVYVNIINRAGSEDINGTFKMTFDELKGIEEELQEYMIKFPIVD